VRAEDAFDVAAVTQWLQDNAIDSSGVEGEPAVQQFSGGASNLTYLLSYPQRDVILRRPPHGTKPKGAHDMGREFRIQQALAPVFPLVPTMVGHCADETVIGSEFYVMDRLDGLILRKDMPAGVGLDDPAERDRLCSNAIDPLVALHSADLDASGLRELDRGPGYVERQVGGWIERYRRARTDDVGDFAEVMAWLEAHQPAEQPHTMIHNDFRFDNRRRPRLGARDGRRPAHGRRFGTRLLGAGRRPARRAQHPTPADQRGRHVDPGTGVDGIRRTPGDQRQRAGPPVL
jgi:aminoglycoside phosphotransferase (APT) family kinase protein